MSHYKELTPSTIHTIAKSRGISASRVWRWVLNGAPLSRDELTLIIEGLKENETRNAKLLEQAERELSKL